MLMWREAKLILAEPARDRRGDHIFFVSMAVAIAATVVIAFTTSFLRTDLATKLDSTWVQAHVTTFGAWILLFFAQTVLIASHRADIHRRVGIFGAGLAGVMIALTVGAALGAFWTSQPRPGFEALVYFTAPHVDMIAFTIFVTAGLLLRNRPDTHKRLMLLATISLLDAVSERLPVIGHGGKYAHFAVQDMFVMAGIVYDLVSRERINPAYIWGGFIILLLPPAAVVIFTVVIPGQ
jgi:MFS family permease